MQSLIKKWNTTWVLLIILLSAPAIFAEESLTEKGKALYKKDKCNEAIPLLTKAIEANPKDDQAFKYRSACYTQIGRYKEALADCAAWTALSPKEAMPFTRSAWIYAKTADYKKAVAFADQSIARDPQNADTYDYRGVAKSKLQDYAGAASDFEKEIELKPDSDTAHSNLANCHLKLKKYELAIKDTDRAIAICESRLKQEPDSPPPVDMNIGELYVLRSRIHLKLGQKELSEQDSKKAMFHGVFASFSDDAE